MVFSKINAIHNIITKKKNRYHLGTLIIFKIGGYL